MNWSVGQPFQALTLTGGGYRGLYTAKVLEVIESNVGAPIGRHFDLISGTSIGGILALAVAFEIPMKSVLAIFENHGEYIFPSSNILTRTCNLIRNINSPKYSTDPLRKAIVEIFGNEALLGDAIHPLAIPAVNVTQGRPQVFKTRHLDEWKRDSRFKVVDIALATAAAPTFFELAEVDGCFYADGGLFANAPDLIAIHEAEHFFEVPINQIKVLSIGTTTKSYSVSLASGQQFGIADWMAEQRLFSVIISAQQQFVEQIVSHRLGSCYVRIDHEPSQEQARDLGLDTAGQTARKTLVALAQKTATDNLRVILETFFPHNPSVKIIKE